MKIYEINTIITVNNFRLYIFSLFTVLLFFSCNDKVLFSEKSEFSDKEWKIFEKKEFYIEINELREFYNIYITLDIYDDYLNNNIWLFVQSTSPSGNQEVDTVMYYFSDKSGKWFAERKNDVILNKFLFKKKVKFPEKGKYKIVIEHGMRENNLPLIKSAGIIIEQAEKK